MSSEGRLEARVWTRARLAELCGITEEQVVEWALLMGNDYTEGMLLGELGEARRVNGRPEKVSVDVGTGTVDPQSSSSRGGVYWRRR